MCKRRRSRLDWLSESSGVWYPWDYHVDWVNDRQWIFTITKCALEHGTSQSASINSSTFISNWWVLGQITSLKLFHLYWRSPELSIDSTCKNSIRMQSTIHLLIFTTSPPQHLVGSRQNSRSIFQFLTRFDGVSPTGGGMSNEMRSSPLCHEKTQTHHQSLSFVCAFFNTSKIIAMLNECRRARIWQKWNEIFEWHNWK